jgi:hypothetical protein
MDEALEARRDWVGREITGLRAVAEFIAEIGASDDAAVLGVFRGRVGEVIDALRHMADDPQWPAEKREFFLRQAANLNDAYAELLTRCEDNEDEEEA